MILDRANSASKLDWHKSVARIDHVCIRFVEDLAGAEAQLEDDREALTAYTGLDTNDRQLLFS